MSPHECSLNTTELIPCPVMLAGPWTASRHQSVHLFCWGPFTMTVPAEFMVLQTADRSLVDRALNFDSSFTFSVIDTVTGCRMDFPEPPLPPPLPDIICTRDTDCTWVASIWASGRSSSSAVAMGPLSQSECLSHPQPRLLLGPAISQQAHGKASWQQQPAAALLLCFQAQKQC